MRSISPQTENRIVELWFKGFPRDTIARRVAVSGSTVSKVISQLPECLRPLRALSVELRKSGKSLPEALKGANLLSKLNDLGVELDQVESYVRATRKISKKEGYAPKQVVQAAMKLSDLEEESGKSYPEAMREFKAKTKQVRRLDENVRELKSQGQDLEKECKTTTKKLEKLNRGSMKAQEVLDRLDKAKEELAAYGLRPDDYENVKNFLNEIHRLGGDPAKAVEILKETSSLESKLQEETEQLNRLKQLNKGEEEDHSRQVTELTQKKERLESDTAQVLAYRKEKFRQLDDKEYKQRERIKGLTKRIRALEQQYDARLKKQAAQLKVQPDIDLVSKALPIRKRELAQSEQALGENKALVAAAKALGSLFAKNPYDRNALIRYMQLTKHSTAYNSFDNDAHQIIVKLMAKQGYVPIADLEAAKKDCEGVKKDAEKKIATQEEQTKMWMRIARDRLREIEALKKQLRIERAAKDKKLDEAIIKKGANIIAESAKRIWPT